MADVQARCIRLDLCVGMSPTTCPKSISVLTNLPAFTQIGYFLKNLDQTNVNNAFLSGMKEDLNMYGNELVTSTSIWTVGYVIGQIPSNLLLTRVSPRWVIPSVSTHPSIYTLPHLLTQLGPARARLGRRHHRHIVRQVLQEPLRPPFPRRPLRVRLLPGHPLHAWLVVHPARDRQAGHDLLAQRLRGHALQRLPPGRSLHKPARRAGARGVEVALRHRRHYYTTAGCDGVLLLPQFAAGRGQDVVDDEKGA